MIFDLRKSLSMVRVEQDGKVHYNFYNLLGREMQLSGIIFKEIVDKQLKGELSTSIMWGTQKLETYRTLRFDDHGDLLLDVTVGPHCYARIPYSQIKQYSNPIFKVINSIEINHHFARDIKTHLRAIGHEVPEFLWFDKLTVEEYRDALHSFSEWGPKMYEDKTREQLDDLHEKFRRKHDEHYKYTHDSIGLAHDEQLPADLYEDTVRSIKKRSFAPQKTIDMMRSEIANVMRIFEIGSIAESETQVRTMEEAYCAFYNHLVVNDDGSRIKQLKTNPQFVINFIYGMAADLNWIQVNAMTEDYRDSLVNRLMQEIAYEISHSDLYVITEQGVELAKVESTETKDGKIDLDALDEEKLRALVIELKLCSQRKANVLDEDDLRDLCYDHFGYDHLFSPETDEKKKEKGRPKVRSVDEVNYGVLHDIEKKYKMPKQPKLRTKLDVLQSRECYLSHFFGCLAEDDWRVLSNMINVDLRNIVAAVTNSNGARFSNSILIDIIKRAAKKLDTSEF